MVCRPARLSYPRAINQPRRIIPTSEIHGIDTSKTDTSSCSPRNYHILLFRDLLSSHISCSYFLAPKVSCAFTYSMDQSTTLLLFLKPVAECLRALSLLSSIPFPPIELDHTQARPAHYHEIAPLLAKYPYRAIDRQTAQWLIHRLSQFILAAEAWVERVKRDSSALSELRSNLSRRRSCGRDVGDVRAWAVYNEWEAGRAERDCELQRWWTRHRFGSKLRSRRCCHTSRWVVGKWRL